MAQNTQPIFTKTPIITFGQITTADAVSDGTSANDVLLFTGNATNGSFLTKLVFTPRSTSGAPTSNAAAIRVYINNGGAVGTAASNVLYQELSVPAIVLGVTATVGIPSFTMTMNIQIPASYRVYVGVTSFAANTQWAVTAIGGDY